ncbi:beta-1,4 N-acetylgalactosaminyltransferase 2-like isoform X2 [Bolinopsis microptera]
MDNRLIYERTGRCVNYKSHDNAKFLELIDCSDVTESFFTEDKDEMLYIQRIVKNEELCITPMSEWNDLNVTTSPCLEDPVGLTRCNKHASRILLMKEDVFQEDRKLLKMAVVPPNSSCDFKACGFNKREPVKLLPPDQVGRCTNMWECVTLAVKTTRRPHLILRLARSVRDSLGFDLPIVAYDDGPNDYPDEIYQQIAEYPLLQYVVGKNEDLGIARGRNLAVMQVKTKYFFLLDDDIKFNEYTKLDKLVEILDTTDVAVASAAYKVIVFTSYLEFGHFNENKANRRLGVYHEACTIVNQTIPNHPSCVRCDITSNVFLARTKEILDIGGWDPELMILEHKDIFIRLKAAGMKVALCPDVKVDHARPSKIAVKGEDYSEKRRRAAGRFRALINNRWNIQNIFDRSARNHLVMNHDTGEITYKEEKEHESC